MTSQDEPTPESPDAEVAAAEDDVPGDDSFLMGVSGVDEQVLAEVARAEAQLKAGVEPDGADDGAVV